MSPTHFIAVRVLEPSVLESFGQFLEHVKRVDGELARSNCLLSKSHVTLMTLNIPAGQEEDVKRIFQESLDRQRPLMERVTFQFEGVGYCRISGGNDMLFSHVRLPDGQRSFHYVLKNLKSTIEKCPGVSAQLSSFLHATLVNTKIGRNLTGNKVRIGPEIYEPYVLHEFGAQRVGTLQLLKMGRGEGGYYKIVAEGKIAESE